MVEHLRLALRSICRPIARFFKWVDQPAPAEYAVITAYLARAQAAIDDKVSEMRLRAAPSDPPARAELLPKSPEGSPR